MDSHFAHFFPSKNFEILKRLDLAIKFHWHEFCKVDGCGINGPRLRKESYAWLDTYFFDCRAGCRCAGLHRHCRGGGGNREGPVLYFSRFIFGVIDSPTCRQMTRLKMKGRL